MAFILESAFVLLEFCHIVSICVAVLFGLNSGFEKLLVARGLH